MLPLDLQPVQSVRQAMQTQTWIRRRSATRVRPADTRRRVPLFVCSVQLARQIMIVIQELRACRVMLVRTVLVLMHPALCALPDSLTWIQIRQLNVSYAALAVLPASMRPLAPRARMALLIRTLIRLLNVLSVLRASTLVLWLRTAPNAQQGSTIMTQAQSLRVSSAPTASSPLRD